MQNSNLTARTAASARARPILLSAWILLSLPALPANSAPVAWRLKPDSLGPITIGMSFEQVNQAIGGGMNKVPAALQPSPGCYMLTAEQQPAISFMFIDDVLKRIDITKAGIRSAAGLAVGEPASKVRRAYGQRLHAEPDAYDDREQYLSVVTPDGRFGIRYETANGKIKHFYSGAWQQVQYSEGCL